MEKTPSRKFKEKPKMATMYRRKDTFREIESILNNSNTKFERDKDVKKIKIRGSSEYGMTINVHIYYGPGPRIILSVGEAGGLLGASYPLASIKKFEIFPSMDGKHNMLDVHGDDFTYTFKVSKDGSED
jgi:hypothetical protein